MLSSFVLSQILIRTLGTRFSDSGIALPGATQTVNPVESALPKNPPITPLQSSDPKTLDLKSFRIRTYEKRRGEGGKLLTGILLARMAPIRVQQLAVPRAHPSSRKHPQEASSCCHLRERSSLGGGSFSSHVSARS